MLIDPETALLLAIIGGVGTVVTFMAYRFADKAGPMLEPKDLLPLPPWEGPPLPRFIKTKPEVLEVLRRR